MYSATVSFDESCWLMNEMRTANRKSIFCDGIDNVADGCLVYTNDLVAKVKKVFNMDLPKTVKFENIDETAEFSIKNIINHLHLINDEKAWFLMRDQVSYYMLY